MGSIWSSTATQAGASPFATTGMAPKPGGGAAAKFQSLLQSAGKQAPSPVTAGSSSAANPVASSSTSSSASDSNATISANDFLTLLVTEMQNQDPTADTDPNAYIDQLVQINSLEQLISINQNLETVLGAAGAAAPASVSGAGPMPSVAAAQRISSVHGSGASGGVMASAPSTVRAGSASHQPARAPGNLSVPGDAPASHAVARTLDGRVRGARRGHAIRDIPTQRLP